jgi:hypothetical protein
MSDHKITSSKTQLLSDQVSAQNPDLVPVIKTIDEFLTGIHGDSYDIPYELTNKQRSVVHELIKRHGLYSESIVLKGSNNEKIRILKLKPDIVDEKNTPITYDLVDMFARFSGAHFPCTDPQTAEYYVDLFDCIFGTRTLWDLFVNENDRISLIKEATDVSKKINDVFLRNAEYKKLLDTKLKGVETRLKKDVYNISNVGKVFVSFDMKTANFTALCDSCPSLFTKVDGTLMTWYEFVKQYTKSEFIAKSKYFRELCFGMTGFISKAATLQEIFMDDVHTRVLGIAEQVGISMTPRMKSGDENLYELTDPDKFIESIDNFKAALSDKISKLHIRVYVLEQIENKNYFLKKFSFNTDWYDSNGRLKTDPAPFKSKIEFKCVPKHFMPQIIRWYKKEKIQDEDLIFMHDRIKARFLSTIFE